jgi:hypothetical protein
VLVPALRCFHRTDVSRGADVSEMHATSCFRVEVCSAGPGFSPTGAGGGCVRARSGSLGPVGRAVIKRQSAFGSPKMGPFR